jgi:hypothetical protein
MYQVAIVFTNGTRMTFDAQEFDVGLSRSDSSGPYNQVHKFTYKDAQGNDTPIYFNPTEVAGIAVVPVLDGTAENRSLIVA